jgi:hypothetical protein
MNGCNVLFLMKGIDLLRTRKFFSIYVIIRYRNVVAWNFSPETRSTPINFVFFQKRLIFGSKFR